MVTLVAKDNLEKDKNVLGKEWFSAYGGYFSDEGNMQLFIDAVKPALPDGDLDILYVASASGFLGEKLIKSLDRGRLTITDISQKHLDENKNPLTKKICVDLLEMDLGNQFDVIMMRSSLDYFPSRMLQVRALKIIREHLKSGGLFINQPAYIPVIEERNLISNIYNVVGKIGNRFFQSSDLIEIYKEAGFEKLEKIGEGKIMILTEKDHIQRYGLTDGDVGLAQSLIRDNMQYAQVTQDGYELRFEFPIFLSR